MNIKRSDAKRMYLASLKDENKIILAQEIFQSIKNRENRHSMDLSEMPLEKLDKIFKFYATKFALTYEQLLQWYQIIYEYIEFCVKSNCTNVNNALSNYDINNLKAYAYEKKDHWLSRDIIDKYQKMVLSDRDKFIIEAIYTGFSFYDIDELFELTLDDIDFKNQLIYLKDRTIKASNKFLKYAKAASKQYEFLVLNYQNEPENYVADENANTIVKCSKSAMSNGEYVTRLLRRYNKYTNGQIDVSGGVTILWYHGIVQNVSDIANNLSIRPFEVIENLRLRKQIWNQFGVPETSGYLNKVTEKVKSYL